MTYIDGHKGSRLKEGLSKVQQVANGQCFITIPAKLCKQFTIEKGSVIEWIYDPIIEEIIIKVIN